MRSLFTAAVAYPAFLLLGLVATYRAIVRQARGQQTWAKTERLMEEPLPTAPAELLQIGSTAVALAA